MNKIKNILKKIVSWTPDYRLIAILSVFALVVLLIPIFRICLYCIPWYDDYGYGVTVRNFLEQEFSIRSFIQGITYVIHTSWWAWQGTFSSIFFMAIVPIIWNDNWYFMGCMFLVAILTVSIFIFVKVLVRDVLKAQWRYCIILQSLTAIMVIELIYTAREGFFWYNGGVHYIGMHSFFLLSMAAQISILIKEKNKGLNIAKTIVCILLSLLGAVLTGGANYVTALQALTATVLLICIGGLLKNLRTFLLLPSLTTNIFCFLKNINAPGNTHRQAYYQGLDAFHAILQSFVEAFRHLWLFTGFMTILFLILAIPVIYSMLENLPAKIKFRFPLLVLAISFCFYATGFTPSLYAMGDAGLSRTLNAVKITYQILLLFNEVYIIGWIHETIKHRAEKKKETKALWTGKCVWWFYPLIMISALIVFSTTFNKQGSFSSYGSYYYVHTGEALNYYNEWKDRVALIQSSGSDVIVTPMYWKPYIIRLGELNENPEAEENKFMATWYSKSTISCIDPDARD